MYMEESMMDTKRPAEDLERAVGINMAGGYVGGGHSCFLLDSSSYTWGLETKGFAIYTSKC